MFSGSLRENERSKRLKGRNELKRKQGRKGRKSSNLGVRLGREPEDRLHLLHQYLHHHHHPHLMQKTMSVTQSAQLAVVPTEVWIEWLANYVYVIPGIRRNVLS